MRVLFLGTLVLILGLATSCQDSEPKATTPELDQLTLTGTFQDSTLHVQATCTLTVPATADSLLFLLNPGVALDTILAPGLVNYALAQRPDRPFPYWQLNFAEPVAEGTALEVTFDYTLDLAGQNHMRSAWIELNTDKLWFPNPYDINHPFTYSATLKELPAGYTFLGHQDAEFVKIGNTLTIKQPNTTFEVLVVGGADLRTYGYDDELQLIAHTRTSDSTLQAMGKIVRTTIDFLNGEHGSAQPIEEFTVLLRNTPRSELGYQYNRTNLILTGEDFNDYANLSHEIAHFWWQHANFIEEPWMNESFANYSMHRVMREFDPERGERIIKRTEEATAEAIPVAEAWLFAEGAYPSYYHKGGLLLLDLEEKIGVETMDALLTKLVAEEISTTEGFLAALEAATGATTRAEFEKKLYEE